MVCDCEVKADQTEFAMADRALHGPDTAIIKRVHTGPFLIVGQRIEITVQITKDAHGRRSGMRRVGLLGDGAKNGAE